VSKLLEIVEIIFLNSNLDNENNIMLFITLFKLRATESFYLLIFNFLRVNIIFIFFKKIKKKNK
jgi:hypothetical protein